MTHNTPERQPGSPSGDREVFGAPPEAKSMTRYIRPTLWGIVVVYAALILLLNRNNAEINLVFATVDIPLILALLLMFILGAGGGSGFMMMRARAKRKELAGHNSPKKK